MSGRIVRAYSNSDIYIYKQIPHYSSLEGINFPSLDEYMETEELNLEKISDTAIKSAIEQQYSEWYNWFIAPDDMRHLLAPIVGTDYDKKTTLPILIFPKFIPLMEEDCIYKFNQIENLIITGMNIQNYQIPKNDVINFLRELPALCDYLELNEEDIINNPSNLGFNSIFGLRIIDYGLKRGKND